VRDEAGLCVARGELAVWQNALPESRTSAEHELNNMILLGGLMATAAIERRESRGGHCRSDFPDADPRWQRHIVLSKAAAARCAKEVR
jgi:L-aspartate oxidase